jgi:adenine/guanine phosphoribosyltransferase-like PRPP-binding protein
MQYWQDFLGAASPAPKGSVWPDDFPATMPDGSRLRLPLRDLGERAVAGLIVNQASFVVLDRLVGWLADQFRAEAPDIVVGLPTLGHLVGAGVARALGHANWVAPGTSRKLWYEDALSVPLASITSPDQGRRLWLDPRLVERLRGRRVLLVDDVVSTGASALAALDLLRAIGVTPVALAACMLQGDRWRRVIPESIPVRGVFATPMFRGVMGGWTPIEGTAASACCSPGGAIT